MSTVTASPESPTGIFRTMRHNAMAAFNQMEQDSTPVLGYFCAMGGVLVAAAGYLLADGVTSGSVAEAAFGAGAAPVGVKYIRSTASELLRRRRAAPEHPEVKQPENPIDEIKRIIVDGLDRYETHKSMREEGTDMTVPEFTEYLDSGLEQLEDFANGGDEEV